MTHCRPAGAADAAFLTQMLALAADWRADATPRSAAAILDDPQLARYVADWPRHGDLGVIAIDDTGQPVGAAWARRFSETAPGYGFVSPTVPEVSLAVRPHARGAGVGEQLLGGLMDAARRRGVTQLSLSVERANPARTLYARRGFTEVGGTAGAVTMVVDLDPKGSSACGGPDWT